MQTIHSDAANAFSLSRSPRLSDEGADATLRRACMLSFRAESIDVEDRSAGSLQWNTASSGASCAPAVKSIRLRSGDYALLEPGERLMLTHVFRHSASSVKWRNRTGDTRLIEPGDTLASQGSCNALVQLTPTARDGVGECVCIITAREHGEAAITLFEAYDSLFTNSAEACVRELFGGLNAPSGNGHALAGLRLLDIDIAPYSHFVRAVSPNYRVLALLTSGSLHVNGFVVEPPCAAAFHGRAPAARLSTFAGASVLWLEVPRGMAAALDPETESAAILSGRDR